MLFSDVSGKKKLLYFYVSKSSCKKTKCFSLSFHKVLGPRKRCLLSNHVAVWGSPGPHPLQTRPEKAMRNALYNGFQHPQPLAAQLTLFNLPLLEYEAIGVHILTNRLPWRPTHLQQETYFKPWKNPAGCPRKTFLSPQEYFRFLRLPFERETLAERKVTKTQRWVRAKVDPILCCVGCDQANRTYWRTDQMQDWTETTSLVTRLLLRWMEKGKKIQLK